MTDENINKEPQHQAESEATETLKRITQSIKEDIQIQNKVEMDGMRQALSDAEAKNKDLIKQQQQQVINKELIAIAMANGLYSQAGSSVENAVKGLFKVNENGKVVSADSNYLNTPESFIKGLKKNSSYMFQGQQANDSVISHNEQLENAAASGDFELYKQLRQKH